MEAWQREVRQNELDWQHASKPHDTNDEPAQHPIRGQRDGHRPERQYPGISRQQLQEKGFDDTKAVRGLLREERRLGQSQAKMARRVQKQEG